MARIHYILTNDTAPSGGIRIMLDHVRLLARHGFDAVAVSPHPDASPYGWVPALPPLRHVAGQAWEIAPGDVLVMSERETSFAEQVRAMRRPVRVILCQNHHDLAGLPITRPQAYGIDAVIATSGCIARHLEARYGYPGVPVIPCGIDTDLFAPPSAKQLRIAAMPRKRRAELLLIRAAFAARGARYASIPWDLIDGSPAEAVARTLGPAALFLALGRAEGLGLPPLEAMAAGCLVAGYHGGGGLDYADDANGLWLDDADGPERCADRLAEAADLALDDRNRHLGYLRAGYATAARYSMARMEAALIEHWRAVCQPPVAQSGDHE